MVKTHVSSKGQTTIPAKFRSRWKSLEVVWVELPDGSAQVRPVPDIMMLLGSARTAQTRDPKEKEKGRQAWAEGSGEGRSRK
jgi:bifunctional DNA-binding transcriptional regulator/antitoxin component of YhaV-PrlF toxin-antitoxin module